MKAINLLVVLVILCVAGWVKPIGVYSQSLPDSTINFYSLSSYYDHYYDSLIQLRGSQNMQGTGYKDYLRWKWFYTTRSGVGGSLGEVWETISNYYNNFTSPSNYEDQSDWSFIGPRGFPARRDPNQNMATGKGMMLSLWVSDGDHSLIYAGSHHGGLWKTADGGNSWIPLNDLNPQIHGVQSLAVDPTNTNTVYISCGSAFGDVFSYSEGLFKSSDGGLSWNQLDLPIIYPQWDWQTKQRLVALHPTNPDIIYFITYFDVFRSTDQGNNWVSVFHRDYFPWGPNWQQGFFDFEVAPWNPDRGYLAGNEIYKINNVMGGGNFEVDNLSDQVFYAGLNPLDFAKYFVDRTEISMQASFPNKVWFAYCIKYITLQGDTIPKLRIVRYDEDLNSFSLECDDFDHLIFPGESYLSANANKLEFSVSPNDLNKFYLGGINIMEFNKLTIHKRRQLKGGSYPDECWVHDDIRDMQVFSDNNGHDIIFLADDSGITRGIWEPNVCNDPDSYRWHWDHLCESEMNGLEVTEFYGIGSSEEWSEQVAGGCQDLCDMIKDGNEWNTFGSGDGSELIFDPNDGQIFYFTEWQGFNLSRTMNGGRNNSTFFKENTSYNIIPLELDPFDPSVLYSGNLKLYRFRNVNDFTIGPEITPDVIYDFNNKLTSIQVAKYGNTRRYFVSTIKSYDENSTPRSDFEGCIYYWNEGDSEPTDISANLDACRFGFISGIEVNPENPDQIWVCASKYSVNEQNSKVYTLTLPGTDWHEYSQGLPLGMPVIKIKFIPTLRSLYSVTDVGVFVRNINDQQWYSFSNNLPAKIVTDMEFNLPNKKIYVSTFGRGLWETEFEGICDNSHITLRITSHEIWSVDKVAHGDIIIENGGILEIDQCKLYMPEFARIIVRPGGELIVDGGTITNACPSPWRGIEVWGSNQCQSFPEYFGRVYLINHSVIKNATVGISNYSTEEVLQTGGIIYATDATFRNNQIAVNYRQFKNIYQGREYPYRSGFTNCKFEFNQNKLPGLDFEYFIKMDRVNGIHFNGCDFVNYIDLTASQGELQDKFGTGIYSFGSQFYVDQTCLYPIVPCTQFKPSTFTGLNYGIYAMGIDPVYTISVNKSIFRDNVTGIFISGIENATVTRNDFYVNKKFQAYNTYGYVGLYLDLSTGFTVEENYFSQDGDDIFHNTGIVVKDAGEKPNEIYNNFFTNRFEAGITALNKNRNSKNPDNGLVIKCNEFTVLGPFDYDILVIEDSTVTENSGIAKNQGSNADETSPAGNLFSRYSLEDWKDYVNLVDKNYIDYYMNDPASEIRVKPRWYTNNNIFLNNTGIQFEKDKSCKSHLTEPDPNPDPPHLKAALELSTLKLDSAQTELSALVDGGNTDQLVSDVTISTPPEAYDLYSDLMLKSPYLSDTVLIESIQKEDVLDNVMIEDILVANSQAAKSAEIQESLDSKNYLLSEDQRENIDQGRYTTSAKEIIESRVAWQNHNRAMILDDLISLYKNDTVNQYAQDSLTALLNSENETDPLYQLAFIRINQGDTIDGLDILTGMENSFDFDNRQLTIHEEYEEYAEQFLKIVNVADPEIALDSLTRSTLYALAAQKTSPGVYSRNVLQFFDTLVYIEPYLVPSGIVKTGEVNYHQGQLQPIVKGDFKVYPNPAKSYFIAEYSVQNLGIGSLVLLINDISGSTLHAINLQEQSGHKIISTKDLKPGLYFCKFVLNGEEKQVVKLSVVK